MDGVTLDGLLGELRATAEGRHLRRPRLLGRETLAFELTGARGLLAFDIGRHTAGIYRLEKPEARHLAALAGAEPTGRDRQALLLLRKHADGIRIHRLVRVDGERTLVVEAGRSRLILRVGGGVPALTLVVDDVILASLGTGAAAWPLPEARPDREWDRVDPRLLEEAAREAERLGERRARGILAACPPLGPLIARSLDGSAASLEALRARLVEARPTILAPGPLEGPGGIHDWQLRPGAVWIAPVPLALPGLRAFEAASWAQAASQVLRALRRGAAFARRRDAALGATRREIARLSRLGSHLRDDAGSQPDPAGLRRAGEALLAFGRDVPAGAERAELPDPRGSGTLSVRLDARLSPPANADRLFERARRIERGRRVVASRVEEAARALAAARAREAELAEALDLADLPPETQPRPAGRREPSGGTPRRFLTARGLPILVGRGARENHRLTFQVARPEDLWLHARDVPGAHVILRDDQGRAGPEDVREAAEVAAFYSDAHAEPNVDVHVARRKHVRPTRGAPGRVHVTHSETRRVVPRDPEGRLRRR